MNGQFDLGSITPTKYFFTIASTLGLLFAFIGTDDSESGIALQLIRWQFQTLGPMAFLIASHIWLSQHQFLRSTNPWLNLTFSGVLGVALFSPLSFLVDLSLQSEYPQSEDWLLDWLEELSNILPPAIIAWIAMNAPWVLGYRVRQIANHGASNAESPPAGIGFAPQEKEHDTSIVENERPSKFFDLLRSSLTGELLYLKAELHYLLAVTKEGKTLVLYNLKDATSELSHIKGYDGFHCHRSYWVVTDQVRELTKNGRQGLLVMSDGEEIPVSRSKLTEAMTKFAKLSSSH